MKRPICPGCGSALQPFFARAADTELEIDLCQFCGGAFVHLDRLRQLAGNPLVVAPAPGKSSRHCARCTLTMTPGTVREVQVELCPSCSGVYLDDGELHAIARRQVGLRTDEDRVIEIACARCGKRQPARSAIDDPGGGGLLCQDCGHVAGPIELVRMPERLTRRKPLHPFDALPPNRGPDLDGTLDALASIIEVFLRR